MTVEGQLGSTQNNAKKGLKRDGNRPILEEVKRPRTEDVQVLAVVAGYRKGQIKKMNKVHPTENAKPRGTNHEELG